MKIKNGFRNITNSKTDPTYAEYVKSCLTKKAYDNKGDAIEEAIRLGVSNNKKTQVYFCNFCGKYHVTTHCRETQSGSNHNIQVVGRNRKILKKAFNGMNSNKKHKHEVIENDWNEDVNGYYREFDSSIW